MAMTHAGGLTAGRARGQMAVLFDRPTAGFVAAIWAAYALATGITGFAGVFDALTTDDAMRLTEVRDLLAGQSWFDLHQYRLDPPDGVIMHWSRLIDLPIALILAVSERLLPGDAALKLTLTLWPLLTLLPTLAATASASRTLAGPSAAVIGPIMLLLSPAVTSRFAPGAIDHHGVQVALALILLACALRIGDTRRAAIGAGLAAAAMTAIGMETAPHVVACAGVIALRWAFAGEALARGARLFGLSFAGGVAVIALTTLAPDRWSAPVCDTLGVGHLALAIVGGLSLAAATRIAEGGLARLASLGLIGVACVAALGIVAPNCFASPYGALPLRLQTDWLAGVEEARDILTFAYQSPAAMLAIGLPLLATLVVALWALLRATPATRGPVATAVAMYAAALAVSAWQVRGLSLAFALAAPLLPMAVRAIGQTGDRIRTLIAMAALSPFGLAVVGIAAAGALGLKDGDPAIAKLCPSADYKALSALPPGLAINPIITGPYVLAFSPLSVIGAPYHRNVDGLTASLDAFEDSEETARAIAVSRNAVYVVACPMDGGVAPNVAAAPGSFAAALLSGRAPAWLERVNPGGRLLVYRVLAGR